MRRVRPPGYKPAPIAHRRSSEPATKEAIKAVYKEQGLKSKIDEVVDEIELLMEETRSWKDVRSQIRDRLRELITYGNLIETDYAITAIRVRVIELRGATFHRELCALVDEEIKIPI